MANIVVIIPTYNEVENIGKMLDVLTQEEFPQMKEHTMRILVVDDNSPDGTADVVREKMKKYKRVELLMGNKEGLGAAYARGMKYAIEEMKADAVVELDADFQHDPKDVKRLAAAFDEGYDYVIGSRYIKGGSIPAQWSFYRKFVSWGGNLFARVILLFLHTHDVTSGFKLTRVKGFLDQVDLSNLLSKYYAYKIHILFEIIKNRGARVKEVPIKFYHRERGSSKIEQKDLFDSFRVTIILFFKSRFFKFAVVGFTGYVINAVGLELFRRSSVFSGVAGGFSGLTGPFAILSQPSAWSAAAATELAIISNFTFNNFWTFAARSITRPTRFVWKFLQFNLTSFGALVIQFVVVGTAVLLFGDTRLVRQIAIVLALIFLVIPYNYTMYNVFIWKTWKIPGLGWFQNRQLVKG